METSEFIEVKVGDDAVFAFDVFYANSVEACNPSFIAELRGRMLDGADTDGEKIIGTQLRIPPVEVFDRISFEMADLLTARFRFVLENVRKYMSANANNDRAVGRLQWLFDKVREREWDRIPIPNWIPPKGRDSSQFMIFLDTRHQFLTSILQLAQDIEEAKAGHGSIAANVKGARPQWMGNASELAYLLTELIEGDHILPPARGRKVGKEGNRAAVADAIYNALDIRDPATDEPVTREYFKSLLRPNSPDRGTFKELFKITRRPS